MFNNKLRQSKFTDNRNSVKGNYASNIMNSYEAYDVLQCLQIFTSIKIIFKLAIWLLPYTLKTCVQYGNWKHNQNYLPFPGQCADFRTSSGVANMAREARWCEQLDLTGMRLMSPRRHFTASITRPSSSNSRNFCSYRRYLKKITLSSALRTISPPG